MPHTHSLPSPSLQFYNTTAVCQSTSQVDPLQTGSQNCRVVEGWMNGLPNVNHKPQVFSQPESPRGNSRSLHQLKGENYRLNVEVNSRSTSERKTNLLFIYLITVHMAVSESACNSTQFHVYSFSGLHSAVVCIYRYLLWI